MCFDIDAESTDLSWSYFKSKREISWTSSFLCSGVFLLLSIWHQHSTEPKETGDCNLPAVHSARAVGWGLHGIFWVPWVCFIICPLWLWALWQFVQLDCLAADFCLTERNLDSKRKKKPQEREGEAWRGGLWGGGWAAKISATLNPSNS